MTLVRQTTVSNNVLPVKTCHRCQQGFDEWQGLFLVSPANLIVVVRTRCGGQHLVVLYVLFCLNVSCLLLTLQYNFKPPTCTRLVVLAHKRSF